MNVVNIVVHGNLNNKLPLSELITLGPIYEYDKEKSHRGYIQVGTHRIALYPTGKCLILGIKDEETIPVIWNKLLSILAKYIDVTKIKPPVIKNIVAVENLDQPLNLVNIKKQYNYLGEIEYEPEIFSGLIWKTEYGTGLLFSSGKIVLLGTDTIIGLNKLYSHILEKITT